MSLKRLMEARLKTVGTKQTLKAVEDGTAKIVYLAEDADEHVLSPLYKLCREHEVPIEAVPTMVELGVACGIEVGSASASIIED